MHSGLADEKNRDVLEGWRRLVKVLLEAEKYRAGDSTMRELVN